MRDVTDLTTRPRKLHKDAQVGDNPKKKRGVMAGVDEAHAVQSMVALARGQSHRIERARLLRALRACQLDPCWLVLHPPPCLQGLFTFDFLRHVPGVGDAYIREINRHAIQEQVNLAVPLGALTPLRQQWLAQTLATRPLQPRPAPGGQWPLASRPQG